MGLMDLDKTRIRKLRGPLLDWFDGEERRYPWRDDRSPYSVLVSEFMLQQTRIATVLERGYYTNWMNAFPDWAALASASEAEILKAWEGLGYYNRARNLQKTAKVIHTDREGEEPGSREEWLRMPGVGPYTAAAVASIAMDEVCGVVDGNVERVFSRLFSYEQPIATPDSKRRFQEISDLLVSPERPGDWNAAIMELGQFLCTPTSPRCSSCPVQGVCQALQKGVVDQVPVKAKKSAPIKKKEQVAICRHGEKVLLAVETSSRRRGLHRLPLLDEIEILGRQWVQVDHFDYAITKYKVGLDVYFADLPDPLAATISCDLPEDQLCWVDLSQPSDSWPAMGAPFKKALLRHIKRRQEVLPGLE